MKLSQRRAVSPIIATLLLIAIAVASGIIVYVFTGSLAGSLTKSGGSQVTQQIQLLAYNFNTPAGGEAFSVYIKNTGTGTVALSQVYVDGVVLANASIISPYTYAAPSALWLKSTVTPTFGTTSVTLSATTGKGIYAAGDSGLLVLSSSTAWGAGSHLVKIVTTSGGIFSYSVVVGQTG
ncbi:MAG: hypothetical protein JRM99_07770 [Nitrososphaerota archaeon]|nr:hypothetical protein [Nitrososphaerota archaeon]